MLVPVLAVALRRARAAARLTGTVTASSIARVGIAVRAPRAVVDNDAARTATRAASNSVDAAGELGGERARERVTGAGRVHDLCVRRRDRPGSLAADDDHAARAERDDDRRAGAAGEQPRRPSAGSCSPVSASASTSFGNQDRLKRGQLAVERSRGRRIDEHGHAALARVARRRPRPRRRGSRGSPGTRRVPRPGRLARLRRKRALDDRCRRPRRSRRRRPRSGSGRAVDDDQRDAGRIAAQHATRLMSMPSRRSSSIASRP